MLPGRDESRRYGRHFVVVAVVVVVVVVVVFILATVGGDCEGRDSNVGESRWFPSGGQSSLVGWINSVSSIIQNVGQPIWKWPSCPEMPLWLGISAN